MISTGPVKDVTINMTQNYETIYYLNLQSDNYHTKNNYRSISYRGAHRC
jgi:hypothetical protein